MSQSFVKKQIILGAGASCGYPLGSDLIKAIIDINNDVLNLPNYLNSVDKNKKIEFRDFYEKASIISKDIFLSFPTSIDFYASRISDQDKVSVIQSLIIAIIKSSTLNLSKNWYGNLLPLIFPIGLQDKNDSDKLQAIKGFLEKDKIRIVTFNYDISLERYLYRFLVNNVFNRGCDGGILQEAKSQIFGIIEHVYGAVEKDIVNYDFSVEAEDDRFYVEEKSVNFWNNDVAKMAFEIYINKEFSSIKLIEHLRSPEVRLLECDCLYIFGFGFDPFNIKAVGLDKNTWYKNNKRLWKKGCFVTNYGIPENDRIKRIILNELSYGVGNNHNLSIPIISNGSVLDALNRDFSLLENPIQPETIPANQSLNGNYTPYFALKNK